MPTRRPGRGRKAHPEVLEVSGGPPGGLGEDGRLTWRSCMGKEAYLEVQ